MEKQSEVMAQNICLNDELSNLKSRFVEMSRAKEELETEVANLRSDLVSMLYNFFCS